jgi:hypothetical protein
VIERFLKRLPPALRYRVRQTLGRIDLRFIGAIAALWFAVLIAMRLY